MAEVRIEAVSKTRRGGGRALSGVSIHVREGEFLALAGPRGCGGSVLLRMIAGLEEITEGIVSIGGRVVNGLPPRERDVATVFQNGALYPHMTVYANMAFGLGRRPFEADEMDRRVREAAQILGIEELLDRKPKSLSGGQRQRVAIGRALVRRPGVFLFDAPFTNLDSKLRVEMRKELSRLHARLRATMLFATHNYGEAAALGYRVAVLFNGEVQQIADPKTLYERPRNRLVAEFVGTPVRDFAEGEFEGANKQSA